MKTARLICTLIASASICCPSITIGYEISTHAGMTNTAYGKSILSVSTSYDRLGLNAVAQKSLGKTYLDPADANLVNLRTAKQFELDKLPSKLVLPSDEQFGVRAWLVRGAIREDDTSAVVSLAFSGSPRDDPYGDLNRYCNHFFDPVNVRALTKFCFNSTLDMSPNWAIGTADAFASPVQRQSFYRNHFTILGAREAMWRALTLKDVDGLNVARDKCFTTDLEGEFGKPTH